MGADPQELTAGTGDETRGTKQLARPGPGGLEMRDKERGDWGSAPPPSRGGTNCDGGEVSGRRYKGATRGGGVRGRDAAAREGQG